MNGDGPKGPDQRRGDDKARTPDPALQAKDRAEDLHRVRRAEHRHCHPDGYPETRRLAEFEIFKHVRQGRNEQYDRKPTGANEI